MKIEKDMNVFAVIRKFPESKKVFSKYKLSCVSCQGAQAESIERCALMHGLDANFLVGELNTALKKEHIVK